MHPLPANKQTRILMAACTLLLTASIAFLLFRAATYTLDFVYISIYTFAEHPLWLHGLRALLVTTTAVTVPIALLLLARSRLFSARHQRLALYLLIPCALLIACDALLLRWENIYTAWHFQYVADHYIRTDYSLRSKLFTIHSRTIFAATRLLFAALTLLLLLQPTLQIKSWSARHQRSLRIFAGAVFLVFAVRASQNLCWEMFKLQIMDAIMERAPKTFPYYFSYTLWEPAQIAFEITLVIAVFYLFRIRRNISNLTRDPTRCPECAYQLDIHMTTCPECGQTRTTHQTPLPEG